MENNFFEDIKEKIGIFIIPALFLLVIILLAIADEKAWNNGFCECGGRWEYLDITHHVSYTKEGGYHERKGYIYKCSKCGKMHEFNEVR